MSKYIAKFNKYLVIFGLCLLIGCEATVTQTGPQKALNDVAKALDANDSAAFLAQIDMRSFAANYVNNLTKNDTTLNTLNDLGNLFGIGGIDNILNNVLDYRNRITQSFEREVASGELMAQCRVAMTPNCPWVPESLQNAQVIELGPDAAIAKVTTPARLTSWIVLNKISGKWLIIGQAVMEKDARQMALGSTQSNQNAPKNGKAVKI